MEAEDPPGQTKPNNYPIPDSDSDKDDQLGTQQYGNILKLVNQSLLTENCLPEQFLQPTECEAILDLIKTETDMTDCNGSENNEIMTTHHIQLDDDGLSDDNMEQETYYPEQRNPNKDPLDPTTLIAASSPKVDIENTHGIDLPYKHPTRCIATVAKNYHYEGKEKVLRKHACDYCTYRTFKKHVLKKHIKMMHESGDYECNMCTFTTKQHENMKRHFNRMHAVQYIKQAKKCGVCEKPSKNIRFVIKNNSILDLIGTCTGMICEICNFTTCLKYCMQSHALLEHGYNFEQSKEITK